jgi:hypothetical protein
LQSILSTTSSIRHDRDAMCIGEASQCTNTVSVEYLVHACCTSVQKQCILRMYKFLKKGRLESRSCVFPLISRCRYKQNPEYHAVRRPFSGSASPTLAVEEMLRSLSCFMCDNRQRTQEVNLSLERLNRKESLWKCLRPGTLRLRPRQLPAANVCCKGGVYEQSKSIW